MARNYLSRLSGGWIFQKYAYISPWLKLILLYFQDIQPTTYIDKQFLAKKAGFPSKAKLFTLISRQQKTHRIQPQLKLELKYLFFGGNPANHSSKQIVSGHKSASWLKTKLFNQISRHQKCVGPNPNFSWGLGQLNFQ